MNSLTPGSICEVLKEESRACLDELEVFPELGSTNSYLLEQACPAPGRCRVALTRHQTNGRGRRDRRWVSPPSTGLCMSIAFTFRKMPDDFPSLSLALGLGVVQALENLGVNGIGLKWPNDIVAQDGKLGGVLPEVHPARETGVTVVAGIGINVDFRKSVQGSEIATGLGQAIDLASCCDELPPPPVLAAGIIDSLIDVMVRFAVRGFSQFHESWQQYDWLRGRRVTIDMADVTNAGIAEGVDTDGALLVNTDGDMRRITSGSVTLSRQPGALP